MAWSATSDPIVVASTLKGRSAMSPKSIVDASAPVEACPARAVRTGSIGTALDASGDPSEMVSRTTLARFIQAGVIPTSANAVICELHRTWNRPDAAEIAELYTMVSPNYKAVMESFAKAQDVAKQQK